MHSPSIRGGSPVVSIDVVRTNSHRLDTWKEIAAFFRRDVRTVQLWEKLEGLPVRRHQHRKLGSVFAHRWELEQWQLSRSAAPVSPSASENLATTAATETDLRTQCVGETPDLSTSERESTSVQLHDSRLAPSNVSSDRFVLARSACALGGYAWNGRSRRALRKALGYYQDAIELDPTLSDGFAGLANIYISLSYNNLMPAREAAARAYRAVTRAVELDRQSLSVRNAFINVLINCLWDGAAAERECRHILDRSQNARTLQLYAGLLNSQGRHNEAIELALEACGNEPESGVANNQLAMAYFYAGDYDRAVPYSVRTLEKTPAYTMGHALLGRIHAQRGDWVQARSTFDRVVELSKSAPFARALVAYACAGQGEQLQALDVLAELEQTQSDPAYPAYDISGVYCALGRREDALRTMRRACESRDTKVIFMHEDPRFSTLKQAMQLDQLAASPLRWAN